MHGKKCTGDPASPFSRAVLDRASRGRIGLEMLPRRLAGWDAAAAAAPPAAFPLACMRAWPAACAPRRRAWIVLCPWLRVHFFRAAVPSLNFSACGDLFSLPLLTNNAKARQYFPGLAEPEELHRPVIPRLPRARVSKQVKFGSACVPPHGHFGPSSEQAIRATGTVVIGG